MLAVERRSQLLDAVDVDDGAAVDPDELLRIQLRLEVGHRIPNQMRLFADVQAHVIARGFTPVDVGGPDEVHAAAGLDDQPVDARLAAADFGNQGEELAAEGGRLPLRELVARVGGIPPGER